MTTVKAFEWKEGDGINCDFLYHTAETPVGLTYWQIECQWGIQRDHAAGGEAETDEAAKDAAFADYSARIMSAIEPDGVVVETPPPQTHLRVIRAQAIEDVLSALTAHELYQYRPKAFQGFIQYARETLVDDEEAKIWRSLATTEGSTP